VQIVAESRELCTQAAALALEDIRRGMRFDKRGMAQVLGMPYRTYQDYAYGRRSVPERVLVLAQEAARRDREIMAAIARDVEQEIARSFPQGIPSVREREV
jgi:hypothetical protein